MSFAPPSRTSTIRQPVLWDSYTTLGIERDQRWCIGEAISKGRKCRASLAFANAIDMQKLLHKLSTRQPDPDALEPMLARIAGYGLCRNKRNKHQEQCDTIVQKWKEQILEAYPERVVDAENAAEQEAAEAPSPPTQNPPSSRPSPIIDDDDLARLRLVRQVLEGLAELSTRATSRVTSETPIPTTEIPHQAGDSTPVASPTPSLRRSTSTHTLSPHPHPHTHVTPCPDTFTTHVSRRTPDAECPICKEPSPDASELTWCKAGCGRSMHKECVELWRTSRMEQWFETDEMNEDMVFTCALCRAEWVDCDCED